MRFATGPAPHLQPRTSVSGFMLRVLAALAPGVVAYVWFFGWGVAVHLLIGALTALAAEAAMLAARRRPLAPYLTDGSAAVTGALLALAVPPLAPWWLTVVGAAFAIVFAKHLYGGLGYNPFNPAMVGYVVLLVSFPVETTLWPGPPVLTGDRPGLVESLGLVFGLPAWAPPLDAVTAATPLDHVRTQLAAGRTLGEIGGTPVFGGLAGAGWEWVSAGYLAGGLYLLYARVIRWRIPLAMLGALFLVAGFFHLLDPDVYASPLFHLFSGAAMLGAFFIATDPVSASTTPRGRLIFGAGVGVLVYVIRTWGGYPDGVAFAVLLMNMAVPLIDQYTRPRIYGEG